jgi:hypothetical protein
MDDFEKKTGTSRDALIDGLNAGKNPLDIVGGNNKLGKSADELHALVDKYGGNAPPMGSNDVLTKLGMTPEDLGADAAVNMAGGSGRGPNSGAPATDFDSLFGAKSADAGSGVVIAGGDKVSKDVQDALDRNGITGRSIFDMVHSQYVKKVPMLFGVKRDTAGTNLPRPLFDLHSGNSGEF